MTGRESPEAAAFEPATGTEAVPVAGTRERAAAVRDAFEALLRIRDVVNSGAVDPRATPAEWERVRMVRAVALALEAAGVPPSALDERGQRTATGYCVTAGDHPRVVRVEWPGPRGSGAGHEAERALRGCARVLGELGWVVLEYRGRGGRRYLEVEAPATIRR
ncbi:hypothetical protein [Embleya hyalina]|uniref:Uncharacterized protein n=1 Tax=Embleya hyalina TaxID=516124 RepID=A0A401YPU2_9ACTN|nr:hypothetical protein [Embleya hyalina]GCD96612.1 hypothetical protein EHYA_04299 [Embleya hyalina]